MLDISVVEKYDSIENLFAKKFCDSNKYPMDNKISELFIKLLLLSDDDVNIYLENKPFLYQLIENKLSVIHTYKLDNRTILFLSFICESAGIVVMYLWYLQYECKKKNLNEVSFEVFVEIFADGFPSSDVLNKLWINQKVNSSLPNSDNLLDYVHAGKSLLNY